MAYEVAYFASLTLPEAKLGDIRDRYLAWILGRWPNYDQLRPQRVKVGIDPRWLPDHIRAAKKLHGGDDYELESRETTDLWLLRYRHRDSDQQSVFFQHQIRVQQQPGRVVLEHGVRRSAPREMLSALTRSPRPRIVEDLLRLSPAARPLNQTLPVTVLGAEDVDDFVGSLLFDPRSVPWVVVSPDEETAKPLIDPSELLRWLRGIAAVAVLQTPEATWALTKALKQRGFGDELRCFDGAVRCYDGNRAAARLPFLMPGQLLATAGEERTTLAAGELARRLTARRMPPSFFSLIEDEDQRERNRTVEHLHHQLAQGTSSGAELRQQARELEVLLGEADQEIARLKREKDDLAETAEASETLRDHALEKLDDETRRLSAQVTQLRRETQDLREKLRAAELTPELVAEISSALKGDPSPIQTVDLVERLYGDRIVFLPEARASAKKAAEFQRPERVAHLLWTLATDYFQALAAGRGDVEARKYFGKDDFAAKDKDNLSARGKKLRTFEWRGADHLMEMHLKDGNKFSDAECLRIHFKWFPEERRIVVGHCGGHLDF
jgi:hypothetical protein